MTRPGADVREAKLLQELSDIYHSVAKAHGCVALNRWLTAPKFEK
jgi:hypothetical protein